MQAVVDEVVRLVSTDVVDVPEEVRRLSAGAAASLPPGATSRLLGEIVEGIRLSAPTITGVRPFTADEQRDLRRDAADRRVEGVGVLSAATAEGIEAEIFVSALGDSLVGLRARPDVPPVTDAGDLRRALRTLDAEAAVATLTPDGVSGDGRPKAVSSLVKLFVLLAVLDAVEGRALRLDDRIEIRAEDVCRLSAGLTTEHVGQELSVAELCRLMILRSDNTATDALLRTVGAEAVQRTMSLCGADDGAGGLRPMRETIDAAWPDLRPRGAPHQARPAEGSTSSDDGEVRRTAAATEVAHHRGLDYFVPLPSVLAAFERVPRRPWTPWSSAEDPAAGTTSDAARDVWYKGGSAPGVLAGAWCDPVRRVGVAFAVNDRRAYGALEEIYAYGCVERFLERLLRSQGSRPAARDEVQ